MHIIKWVEEEGHINFFRAREKYGWLTRLHMYIGDILFTHTIYIILWPDVYIHKVMYIIMLDVYILFIPQVI